MTQILNEIAASQHFVDLSIDERGVAHITLNNPQKHNAFDDSVIARLTSIFDCIEQCDDIRVVVLAANGKSFSAGADLMWMKRMASYSRDENLADANALATMLQRLNFLNKPTIAKVQGAAFGGAVGLVACCDVVLASSHAKFCLSEVKLGLIPATISPYVIQAMGVKAARRYFQTAERFDANKAQQLGLVDDVLAPQQLDEMTDNIVTALLANSPKAVAQAKQLVFDVAYQTIDKALMSTTSERIANIRVSPEGQEGLAAFFEKRQPSWINSKQ
ncbi:enoyl-CoA hydratase/isomerase family protein [Thalassotalea ponticola]|uniref:enoyl-CoA hydratase/isomerase family protein n=1 Tax=Thalassotalea ponticola TaxID=1523392 RepID=UPI0025B5EA54|nr:enoyl-CoA hydratase/isomerase family protein [Thalassotalea ponticola]MDN3653262.1 enoyl-CoA hydratase/isomerase family protein [Thalassotalea ponticola]